MLMKLSPVMSPTGLNFRVQLLILHLTNSRPRQSKLILTPSMPPGGNHRGKTIPLTSLLTHQLQKWSWEGGAGDTLPRGQDATHTGQQHVRMERLPLP